MMHSIHDDFPALPPSPVLVHTLLAIYHEALLIYGYVIASIEFSTLFFWLGGLRHDSISAPVAVPHLRFGLVKLQLAYAFPSL